MLHPTTWAEWRGMYTNLDLWTPIIKEILKHEGISFNHISVSKHPGTHAVFQIDDSYILKIYTPLAPNDFPIEASIYNSLAHSDKAHLFPLVIGQGEIDCPSLWNYLIITMISGSPYREIEPLMTKDEKVQMSKKLGTTIKKYHSVLCNNVQLSKWPLEPNQQRVKKELLEISQLSDKIIDKVIAFLNDDRPSHQSPLVTVHADVTEDHVFLTRKDQQWVMTGLIDVADSKRSISLLEFPAIWFELFKGDKEMMQAFLNTYDSNILWNEETRMSFIYMTLVHQFGIDMLQLVLKRKKITSVHTLEELFELMWPQSLFMNQSDSAISKEHI
ncbi:aminoglycoside phosphotransferase family protein [Pseudalkalibacillus berkeleyi]|uniref:Aminoglycoside phosphotransferase family protein n=1 Tax=Pseudalkalibacillus berkeleyi TaxID=1069813 RepID=A0ABS9GY14_9BACL|nr:aminoglycoside phosphotransferase family protein [Pseudalkalibacillus berkeleyi]MCF6136270.1 aminoglycoside phosphotransferase family protein [Pseudalkalibacillus berkeleyi]